MPTRGAERPIQRVPSGLPGPGGTGFCPFAHGDGGGDHPGVPPLPAAPTRRRRGGPRSPPRSTRTITAVVSLLESANPYLPSEILGRSLTRRTAESLAGREKLSSSA